MNCNIIKPACMFATDQSDDTKVYTNFLRCSMRKQNKNINEFAIRMETVSKPDTKLVNGQWSMVRRETRDVSC